MYKAEQEQSHFELMCGERWDHTLFETIADYIFLSKGKAAYVWGNEEAGGAVN